MNEEIIYETCKDLSRLDRYIITHNREDKGIRLYKNSMPTLVFLPFDLFEDLKIDTPEYTELLVMVSHYL